MPSGNPPFKYKASSRQSQTIPGFAALDSPPPPASWGVPVHRPGFTRLPGWRLRDAQKRGTVSASRSWKGMLQRFTSRDAKIQPGVSASRIFVRPLCHLHQSKESTKRPDMCFWGTKPAYLESRVSVVWGRVRVSEGESQLFRRGESMFPGHKMDAKFPWSILWQKVAVFGAIPCHGMGVAGLTFIPCPGNAGSRRTAT